ncbi:uncharacterized protein LOC127703253 isoform X2 [Mytilus californianus]|uniref:uncharacterized protein LOC127703253 isoform X2 n=1 Tax=Mytilus californianus TaxID=6549 RepID=UPI002246E807|nr:uncharacterized protein LOC127703253 isoform X2 [Mytilus californianus]
MDTPMTTTTIIYLNLMPLVPILNASFVNTLEMVPFSLSCASTGSRPAATVWWTVGQTDATFEASSQENRDSDESYTVTSTLTYVVDRKYNLQPITCKANNTVGGFSNKISLFVRFAPDVSVSNVTYEMKDSTRTINCTAEGYPDTYTFYKWQHKTVYGRFIRELDGEKILTLPVVPAKIRYQDNGEYVCTVSNGVQGADGAEKRKGAAQIIAYAQPVITFDNEERRIQYGEIGKSVEIVVHVYSVPKFYYHTWFNNGKQIQFSTKFLISESSAEVEDVFHGKTVQVDGYVLKLTINDIKNEDYSNYTLILGNGMGEPVEHTVVLELSIQQTIETSSSGVNIGAVTGSLISLLILILVLIFVIVRKRRGDQQSDNTVKFENTGSADQTNVYEEVRNNKESKEKRHESWTKQYEALSLTDTPNTYDDLSNKGPEGKNNQSSTSNYEVLVSKEAPNVYDDLNNKASQETRAQSSTPHYDELGAKDVPNVYDELNNEAPHENRSESSGKHYEELGQKDEASVYDDLNNEARQNIMRNLV